ncbi:unnamed protein product [Heterobilharzia americana]|nr:unnamed protein product [Heterobilharzia americana]
MSDVKYKQLHQFSCGSLMNINRRSLVTSCPHGCIICACNDGLLLYDTKQYFTATQVCKLRRDKPLPSHKPNITISSIDPICWIAFNSDGLTLAVVTSSENRGTLVNLVNVFNVVQHGSTDLSNISRSVRVCGGKSSSSFNFSTDGNGSVTLVDQLPVTADCRCVSWSPKGKQLAICLNGSLSTADGIIQGPLILQVDPQMHQKRLVPLTHLFNSNSRWKDSSPVDLLWTSSYSFLIAVKQYTDENHSFCSTQVLYISTTSKSPEPSAVTVESLCSSRVECDKAQYYFRFLGTNYVAVTWAYVGEEVIILQLPNTSGSLPPQVVMSIELPADGLAVSMDIGVFQEDDERKENYLVYLLTCLSNGSICPYLLNSDNPKILLNPNLPKILSLPIPKSTITSVEKQLIDTAKPESTNNSFSFTPIVNQIKPVVSSR